MHKERDESESEANRMIKVGRLCMKIAGRDAGKHCLIVEVLDKKNVLIDGETRRRKCNLNHLEPLDKVAKLKKSASHYAVIEGLKKLGIKVKEKKTVQRKKKAESAKPAPKVKKAEKKTKKKLAKGLQAVRSAVAKKPSKAAKK